MEGITYHADRWDSILALSSGVKDVVRFVISKLVHDTIIRQEYLELKEIVNA